jgi:NAD(P) transhydrogenase subunit beta
MTNNINLIVYTLVACFFVMSLSGLSIEKTARKGVFFGIVGMVSTLAMALLYLPFFHTVWVIIALGIGGGIGLFTTKRLPMTMLPELMAGFHSLIGLAAVGIAGLFLLAKSSHSMGTLLDIALGSAIGSITFSGSIIAFLKLHGHQKLPPLDYIKLCSIATFVSFIIFMICPNFLWFCVLNGSALALGVMLILPVAGADMPVVVSMLNSYSGWATCGIGFSMSNILLVMTGAFVGTSGAILSYIMCRAMNRSLLHVLFGQGQNHHVVVCDVTTQNDSESETIEQDQPRVIDANEAAHLLKKSKKVIIIPGYGMAVSHAQHALVEMVKLLTHRHIHVQYAIHPVAGRMPGHMNVLLAEANVSYDDVMELEEANEHFSTTDVAIVIGANDITNPSARTDQSSPIYGMPILDVDQSHHILFIKRSLGSGYSGIDNPLFINPKTSMLLGDGKKVCEDLIHALKT